MIDLRRFKRLVQTRLPRESPLCRIIMNERDELPVESFLSKSEVWLELIDISLPSS